MVSNSIGESRKFAALSNHEHRLIYLMVLPWVDKAGRFEADPIIIKSKCLLRLDIEASTVQAWLKDAANVGLINVYEAEGIPVLEIVDFLEHNTPHHKEPESELPDPPAGTPATGTEAVAETPSSTSDSKHGPSMAQAQAKHEPSSPIIGIGSRSRSRSKEHTSADADSLAPKKSAIPKRKPLKTSLTLQELEKKYPELAALVDVWHEHCGSLARWDRVDDDRLRKLEALHAEFGDAAAGRLRDATLEVVNDPEKFYERRGYGLNNLLVKGKILERSDAWRARKNSRDRATAKATEPDPMDYYRERGL